MNDFFDLPFVQTYWHAVAIAFATYIGFWFVKNVLIKKLQKISATTSTYLDDLVLTLLENTKQFYIFVTAGYFCFKSLPEVNKDYGHIANRVYLICTALQFIIWGSSALNVWFEQAIKKKIDANPSVQTTFSFLNIFVKFLLIIVVVLFTLNNMGVNVSTFIAGLGVGGIAIALATQNILGDLFSSLSIVLDKPFIIGDSISLGDLNGTVEHVGLKTTRLRSQTGEQLIISNSDLLSSRIKNFKRMSERRVDLKLGVTYGTLRENLIKGPKLIEDIIRAEENVRFDRAHFASMGDFSLNYEVVYWVLSSDYILHMDIKSRILVKIHEAFEAHQLDFAFPTQTIVLEPSRPRV